MPEVKKPHEQKVTVLRQVFHLPEIDQQSLGTG
jgi:hypothetical protein